MKNFILKINLYIFAFLLCGNTIFAQGNASVTARLDATTITVGDQARLFIEVKQKKDEARLQWAMIPDTFNTLEVVERGKIDTQQNGNIITYKQRLLITGFDSGSFQIPSFQFAVIPNSGVPYTLQTDSFYILVNTVAVDTSKPFRPIKDIILVKRTWQDYIWWIFGFTIIAIGVITLILNINKRKKTKPSLPTPPQESLYERTIRIIGVLEEKQLWQRGYVKEYYTELTDIFRGYLEERFNTPAMELTTDQILDNAHRHPDMRKYYDELANLLTTADLAKFAKAQPLPHEHTATMDSVKAFVVATKQVIIDNTQNNTKPS